MKKILLIKTGAFGDMILTSLSVSIAHRVFPDCEMYLLTASPYYGIYRDCPFIKDIFILPSKKKLLSFLKLTKKLRQKKFDIIFDLQGNLKTNFFSFLFGGKQRIGLYKKSAGRFFLTRAIKKKSNLNPIKLQKVFWKDVSGNEFQEKPQIWIDEKKSEEFNRFLVRNKLDARNYVVFHPSASPEWKTKLWITENWITLGKFFSERNLKVVLVGDKNSMQLNHHIASSIKENVINLSGKTDFSEVALLIKNSRMLITTDSGPMHIGAAMSIKTIALFGPTNPKIHCPPEVNSISAKIDCIFCYKKKCNDMSCMKSISPEIVITEVSKIEKF